MVPAANACCICPSPRNVEISMSMPSAAKKPFAFPKSAPANGKDDPIAFPNGTLPAKIGSRVHGVDAGQPADISRDDPVHGEEDGGRRRAGAGPERVAVADTVGPVPDRVPRGDFYVCLGTANGTADACPEGRQPLGSDRGEPGGRGHGAIVGTVQPRVKA